MAVLPLYIWFCGQNENIYDSSLVRRQPGCCSVHAHENHKPRSAQVNRGAGNCSLTTLFPLNRRHDPIRRDTRNPVDLPAWPVYFEIGDCRLP
jgi:hypothetical protein